jgi:hypothetical protein
MEKHYWVEINGVGNGYMNTLDKIKDALYDLFGDIPIATDPDLMISSCRADMDRDGMKIEIKPCED